MKIKEIVRALEQFAPLPLQDGFDNAGLQIGLTDATAAGALLCLDVTEEVIEEAIAKGCNLIVSHHPLIFKGYKSLTGKDYVERCIMKAIKHDLVIFSAHTNLDNAPDGVNYKIASLLGLKNVRILEPKGSALVKMVTFVPASHAQQVREALFDAGCGCIGEYDSCSYNLEGTGTFKAHEGTHPFCGRVGEMHTEPEIRIETIVPAYLQGNAISALMAAHPYEEPAYDLYPLNNVWNQAGAGIIGELPREEETMTFLNRIKTVFETGSLRYNSSRKQKIRKVAVCGGSGAFLIPTALRQNADLFLTGEIKYHDYFGKEDIQLVEIGHYESEQFTQHLLRDRLSEWFPELKIEITEVNTNPINYL